MLKKKKTSLLEEFLGEYVAIVTKGKTTVSTPEGVIDAPFMMEGTVREMDDAWVLLAGSGENSKLVKIEDICAIETIDPSQTMGLTGKPSVVN